MQTSLKGINKRAKNSERHRFGGLYRLLNVNNLRWAYTQLNKRASTGVDGMTYEFYGENLEKNLNDLVQRLKNKSYKAKLIRRVYIPKSATRMRPLGIPSLEDKIVQLASSRILESIFEADFMYQSYGYRKNKSAYDAVKAVRDKAYYAPINYIVEADIKGFFDNIDHDWLLKMLEERIDDRAFIALIRKWLKAGILDKGMVLNPQTGTPQGGIISPVLANIYLHFVLDHWFKKRVCKRAFGQCYIFRYADDFVCLFQYEADAQAFYKELPKRLAKFNLEVAPEKTKLLNFSKWKHPKENDTFVFLSFEFRREISRKGKDKVTFKIAKKRLQKAVANFKEWIKKERSLKLYKLMKQVRAKLIGHYNYYGVYDNFARMNSYYYWSIRALFYWLNKRSNRKSYNWNSFRKMLEHYDIPRPYLTKTGKKNVKETNQELLFDLG